MGLERHRIVGLLATTEDGGARTKTAAFLFPPQCTIGYPFFRHVVKKKKRSKRNQRADPRSLLHVPGRAEAKTRGVFFCD